MERREFVTAMLVTWALNGVGCSGPLTESPVSTLEGVDVTASSFHRIYDDVRLRDRFFKFLQNIFHLYPEGKFHQLVIDLTKRYGTDEEIYRNVLERLPSIAPLGGVLTHSLPALNAQKRIMTAQGVQFLSDWNQINGYIEVGTTGRYLNPLAKQIPIVGPRILVNDISPTYGPADMIERGRVLKVGSFVDLSDYSPFDSAVIPKSSAQVVSNLIGLHHCPEGKLEGFIQSLRLSMKQNGRLLLREHNVVDETMNTFVSLAHDVFNAGVAITWEDNTQQVRHFRSVADWTAKLEASGFRRRGSPVYQANDPTDNAMLCFERV